MDKIQEKTMFTMNCMFFFHIVDHVLNPHTSWSLNLFIWILFTKIHQLLKLLFVLLIIILLHDYHLSIFLYLLSQDLGHWVQTISIVCFSKFLLTKYEDDKWVEILEGQSLVPFVLLISCDLCCWSMTTNIKKKFQLKYGCHVWSINWPMSTIFWCLVNSLQLAS
jgi:hypothetical protein